MLPTRKGEPVQSDVSHGKASSRTDGASTPFFRLTPGRTRARLLIAALTAAMLLASGLATSAQASNQRPNGELTATCTSITFVFRNFPNAPGNTVNEKVYVHGELVDTQVFTFNGPEGTNTIPISVPPGAGKIDGFAVWNTNGLKGSYDIPATLNCSFPGYTIEKTQEIEGSGEGFTTSTLTAPVGKTVDYRVKVTNTGNTLLTFSDFVDSKCSSITGGPSGPLAPGESATYLCSHTLTESDKNKGVPYCNSAAVTGTPPKGEAVAFPRGISNAEPYTARKTSNTVCVEFTKPNERPNGEVKANCNSITFVYRKFPNANNNTVTEKVEIDNTVVLTKKFTFNGPSGMDTIHITVPPGKHNVDGFAVWNTNGFKGNWDVVTGVKCEATPAFTIEKKQKIEGGAEAFTSSPVTAAVGQTIDYQITVANTGNVPLTFSHFSDAHCSGVAGGPGGALPYEQSATYTCSHTITLADAGHDYENTATVTATPPPGEGSEITESSNTVVAHVPVTPEPAFTVVKAERVAGGVEPLGAGPIEVKRGETIEYAVTVQDTGNTSLTFSSFSDPECDGGTLTGGPSGALTHGESATYTCTHLVTLADEEAGSVDNTASVTGTPPAIDGSPITHESNTVVANVTYVPTPAFTVEKEQRVGGSGPYTSGPIVIPSTATLEYRIVVTNTGNESQTLSFSDEKCDPGTVAGGPGGEELQPGHSTTYTCTHAVVGGAEGEMIENQASVLGVPAVEPETQSKEEVSNSVLAEVEVQAH
jgi:uncharacterized repeat protein (TIGR01451 family)